MSNRPTGSAEIELDADGIMWGDRRRMAISPIDVVKIRLQLQQHHSVGSAQVKYANFLDACRKIVREEGITAFWKGNIPAELLYLVYGGVQFWSYAQINTLLRERQDVIGPTGQKYIAGAAAGTIATVASYPFDLMRTRFAIQASGQAKVYPSVLRAISSIYRADGLRGFYSGLGPSITQIVPYMGLTFGAYESLKLLYLTHLPTSFHPWEPMLCGALAGTLAKLGVYPFDTVRKRVQVVRGPTHAYVLAVATARTTSAVHVALDMARREGVRAFYRGLVPGLVKAGPSSAVTFWAYEWASAVCGQWNRYWAEEEEGWRWQQRV
ncbi:mitochondrial thiamine pyrophosphate transporter [Allomyces arbusculus]|nr:mitochondrial thiamine pyrophosphate transporter [Allomyces arbusculus]